MPKIPLLLLPGLLCDAAVWKHQINHLNDIAEITIPNLNHASTPDEMVAAVLDVAPPVFALAGHSMGGWVALEVMKHASARVQQLCLINTTANPDTKEKSATRLKLIELAKLGQYETIINMLMKLFIYQQPYFQEVYSMLERNKLAFIDQETAMLKRQDCISVLSSVQCPTIIIHSNQDAIFTMDDCEILHRNIAHSELFMIQECGHMSPIESAVDVTTFMRQWLLNNNQH